MFDRKKLYELPLKRDYVSGWGFVEAVRELFQNAIDGGKWDWKLNRSPHPNGTTEGYYTLTISSPNIRLPASCLVLGETSKRGDSGKIGAFGEGFKLALLVLCRLGVSIKMLNDDKLWTPCFTQSEQFDTEIFAVREERIIEHALKGLEYIIEGITEDQKEALESSFLFMRQAVPQQIGTSNGQIFQEEQPALYVGGLFVCATKLKFSYDMKPGCLTLDRDRQTVADFDLQWLTKDMWVETARWDEIAQLIADECPDVEYVHYSCPEMLQAAVYKQFLENNPGGIMARSMEEMQSMVKRGMEKVVYVGGAYGNIVCTAQPPEIQTKLMQTPPSDALRAWLSANRQYMRTPAIVAMKELITQSLNWKG